MPDFSHAISADGSRIFWTAVENVGEGAAQEQLPKALYIRENDVQPQSDVVGERCTEPAQACTVQVDASQGPGPSGGGRFWTATAMGRRRFSPIAAG